MEWIGCSKTTASWWTPNLPSMPTAGAWWLKGKPFVVTMEGSEKLYADYEFEVTNPGGHSSLPRPDNAIYELSDALVKLQHYKFPFELNDVTRAFFEQTSKVQTGAKL